METLFPADYVRRFGCEGLHGAFLQPVDDAGGEATTVSIALPEREDGFEQAMVMARAQRARIVLVCDTAAQTEDAVARALDRLPSHQRVRMDRAAAGYWAVPRPARCPCGAPLDV